MIQNQPVQENELLGGFRNALENGESLVRARQTFLMAGYSLTEVNDAYLRIAQENPLAASNPTTPMSVLKSQSSKAIPEEKKKKSSTRVILITAVITVLVIAGSLFASWYFELF